MYVILIVGARPNFMKAASLAKALALAPGFRLEIFHTGQHYDDNMSAVFFRELDLPEPAAHLGVGSGTHPDQTARIMLALEPEIHARRPDLVIVVGDVNSTLAASLVASQLQLPLAHVEAGLRSFDRRMPEEINRVVTDVLSDFLFTPSADADENLRREGAAESRIHRVGNVMVDTLLTFRDRAAALNVWQTYGLPADGYALVTLHRPSNVDAYAGLADLLMILEAISQTLPVIFPVHPRTRETLTHFGLDPRLRAYSNVHLVAPLGYLEFVSLMSRARVVLTDSGGIQAETTVLGIPCLTLRTNTEWTITLSQGTNRLVGVDPTTVVTAFHEAVRSTRRGACRVALWDGHAAERVVAVVRTAFQVDG